MENNVEKNKKIVAVVPARLGSKRVKAKNLRMIAGKPLIAYILETLKHCNTIDEIFINSESELFGKIAERYGVQFYQRRPELATSESLIDEYIYDFLSHNDCDVLAVVNPTSPFVSSEVIDKAVKYFLENDFDTLLSCEDIRTHCFMNGKAINFSTNGKHPRSQDIVPVQALNFAITIWDAKKYREQYSKVKYGVYTGKLGFFPHKGFANIDIDWEEDFILAEIIMQNIDRFRKGSPAKYDQVLDEIIASGKNTET